jgi:diazepam-binding inhibitor (GABA receptor modulating acyl-CoA-binding protein)
MKDIADALHHLAAAPDTNVEHDDAALDATFAASAERVKVAKTSTAQKLMLYGLYKQAERGDAPTSRPSLLDRVACAKHDAWAAFKGVSSCRAKRTYIAAVDSLLPPPSQPRPRPSVPPVPPPPDVTAARSNATGFDDRAAAVPLQLGADGTTVHFTPKHTWSLKNNPLCGILLLPYLRILLPRWRDVDVVGEEVSAAALVGAPK